MYSYMYMLVCNNGKCIIRLSKIAFNQMTVTNFKKLLKHLDLCSKNSFSLKTIYHDDLNLKNSKKLNKYLVPYLEKYYK